MTELVEWATMDGNEAAARVAHALSEVIAIYPITPSSAMAESSDAWSASGRTNIWGAVPEVVEMQSEAGAAGALHGAVTKGTLGTTFTASQGLLLMIPNMYKIAGELTPAVIHVAARTIATHALSIFGDHSDVMGCRMTGWAMLAAASVQEAQDFALVAHTATLRSRVPFLHFFDGFRTSHEENKIQLLSRDDLRALVREDDVLAHRARGLTPDAPQIRGTAQNPDVFFQAREAANLFHDAVPSVVAEVFDEFAERTGRRYQIAEYHGVPDAERVVIVLGSAWGTTCEAVDELVARGEKVGAVTLRLYRPFPATELISVLPATVRSIAVLDRTKEPGSAGEPLFADVMIAAAEHSAHFASGMPKLIGGRYGLSSKEYTPAMAAAVFAELARPEPKPRFTVGINDDVTHLSLPVPEDFRLQSDALTAVFYGLGSDGTVGAAKNTVKIIGSDEGRYAQGYFVYDSRKSGATTVSHLRFGDQPINSAYLIDQADFVAVHQFDLMAQMRTLDLAKPGAVVLLNSPYGDRTWDELPVEVQRLVIERDLKVWVIDAAEVAQAAGLGKRINTVMQPCFFYLSGVVPREQALARIKASVEKTYGKRGRTIVERNFAAIDSAVAALWQLEVPADASGSLHRMPPMPESAPDFVKQVTAVMLRGEGDLLPVSAMPVDGTFPSGTTAYEKRRISDFVAQWDSQGCASTAASVRSSARTRRSGSRSRLPRTSRTLPRASSRSSTRTANCRTTVDCPGGPGRLHRLRDLRRHHARPARRPRSSTSRSTWSRGANTWQSNGPTSNTSSACPRSIGRWCVRTRSRVPRSWNRSSSSRPAPAVARPPTSGRSPALRRPADHGQRHRVFVDLHGGNLPTSPFTTNADGRGPAGATRCSRTTPSSGWASGWPGNSRMHRPADCLASWPSTWTPTWSPLCWTPTSRTRRASPPSASGPPCWTKRWANVPDPRRHAGQPGR